MTEQIKISALEIENTKRVRAFRLAPSPNGITVIGGKNGQGKTSVLDAIAWGLGGAKFAPSNPQNADAVGAPVISITLSNGLTVERRGKNNTLTVRDTQGKRAGQALLDSFVSQFALDLPKFLSASTREKADALLQVIGVGDKLRELDEREKATYDERHAIGQIRLARQKYAEELPEYPDAPDQPLSISDLIRRQQEILARNGENQRKRDNVTALNNSISRLNMQIDDIKGKISLLQKELDTLNFTLYQKKADLETACKTAQEINDESTAEIEQQIAEFESINAQVAANAVKQAANDEAATYTAQYDAMTETLEQIRKERIALLDAAPLPLPELSVQGGELLYRGQRWDCLAGSEQLRVATAIVRAQNPKCGFILMDKLEQMDIETLQEFSRWAESEHLQIIATRVSTGAECTIIIEDGLPQGQSYSDVVTGIISGNANKTGWEF